MNNLFVTCWKQPQKGTNFKAQNVIPLLCMNCALIVLRSSKMHWKVKSAGIFHWHLYGTIYSCKIATQLTSIPVKYARNFVGYWLSSPIFTNIFNIVPTYHKYFQLKHLVRMEETRRKSQWILIFGHYISKWSYIMEACKRQANFYNCGYPW